MKKYAVLLLCISFMLTGLFMFTACQKIEPNEPTVSKTDSEESKISKPGKTAKITFQIEDNEDNNKVQIPLFVSDEPSEAINSLNKRLEKIVESYNAAKENKLRWSEIISHCYESEQYLQAIVEYQELPSIELDYNVASFNYDKHNDKALTNIDAFEIAKITESELRLLIKKHVKEMENFTVEGFYIDTNGEVQFFVKINIAEGPDAYSRMCTVVPARNSLYQTSETGIQIFE
ncbi:MAG: hypothetical protein GX241_03690 [Ruminococcaceae bacterium]|nr:hypothetical protein [Oscillospiraceae bacterium]